MSRDPSRFRDNARWPGATDNAEHGHTRLSSQHSDDYTLLWQQRAQARAAAEARRRRPLAATDDAMDSNDTDSDSESTPPLPAPPPLRLWQLAQIKAAAKAARITSPATGGAVTTDSDDADDVEESPSPSKSSFGPVVETESGEYCIALPGHPGNGRPLIQLPDYPRTYFWKEPGGKLQKFTPTQIKW